MKKCTRCNEIKNLTEFHKNKRNKDGLQGQCKVCAITYMKNYYAKNPEKIKKYQKKYHTKIEYYLQKTTRRLWHSSKHWGELKILLEKQNYVCVLSGIKLTRNNISLDHIKAKINGGNNGLDNLQFLDYNVNMAKRALSQKDFIKLCEKVSNYNKMKG